MSSFKSKRSKLTTHDRHNLDIQQIFKNFLDVDSSDIETRRRIISCVVEIDVGNELNSLDQTDRNDIEKCLKMEKNRISAVNCRLRKKDYIRTLKEQNDILKNDLLLQKKKYDNLFEQYTKIQNYVSNTLNNRIDEISEHIIDYSKPLPNSNIESELSTNNNNVLSEDDIFM